MKAQGTVVLLLASLLLLLPAAPITMAQEDERLSGPAEVTIDVYLGPGSDTPFTIQPLETTIGPNTNVTFHVVNIGGTDHDFSLLSQDFEFAEEDLRAREDGGEAVKTPLLAPGESYNLTVTFPEDYSSSIRVICSVPGHAENGMDGTLQVGAAPAGGEEDVTDFGVDYLAYWVGIISFVILFIVLFGTFFLFRYGESKQVVDHRTGGPETVTVAAGTAEGEDREMVEPVLPSPESVATVLAILALIGAAFYFLL